MQGVEQGLEFVVGDQVGFAAGAYRCDGQYGRSDRFGIRGRRSGHRLAGLRRRRGDVAEQVEQVVVEDGGGGHAACSVSRASVSSSQSSARR
ncbi:MAG: hypothetical protein DI562_20770 [Stenotrophomonas acidaminiphila]|nr:MAG: hypothetical protein DI562_20770 [Stenotrophomonas acidaminiphila]